MEEFVDGGEEDRQERWDGEGKEVPERGDIGVTPKGHAIDDTHAV